MKDFPNIIMFIYIVLLMLSTGRCLDDFWFTIQPKQNIPVVSGQGVTLECNVSKTDYITFYWTLRGETVKNTTRRFQKGSHLHITRVDPTKDSGEFNCIATDVSTGLSLTSLDYTLSVQWLEEEADVDLQNPNSLDEIKTGTDVVLRCVIEGSPDLKIEWFKNGAKVNRHSGVVLKNKRLYINSASIDNNGLYWCKATNAVGSIESRKKFPLIIQDEDVIKIEVIPNDVIARKDDNVYFHCQYSGSSSIEWHSRNQQPLKNSSRTTIFANGTLLIKNVKGADRGLYSCYNIPEDSINVVMQSYSVKLTISYLDDFLNDPFLPKHANEVNVVPLNIAFEVDCKHPDGLPKPSVWWENPNGRIISDSGHIRIEDGRLIIDGAKEIDSGNYSCVAQNVAGKRKISLPIVVTIPPKVSNNVINVPPIDEGESTSLQCLYDASAYPYTKVMWFKDGKYVSEFGGHFVNHKHNGTLEINEVNLADVGEYVCEVTTRGYDSVKSQGTNLFVKEKLKFVPVPVNRKLELGTNAKIYCKARGPDKPVVNWVKKGEKWFNWPSHVKDDGGILYFKGVKYEDSGEYTCIATNQQDFINATIKVEVVVSPTFDIKPVNTTAFIGDPVMLHCHASSDPKPVIYWDKNTALNGFGERAQVLDNGTLSFKRVGLGDQGIYGCTAGNKGGLKRIEAKLTVKLLPKFDVKPPNISANIGESIVIRCQAPSDPGPILYWDKNYIMNGFGDRAKVMGNGTLIIENVELMDQGLYGCTTQKRGELKRMEIGLNVIKKCDPSFETCNGETITASTVIISMSAASAYMVLVIGLMIWCRCRRKRQKASLLAPSNIEERGKPEGENGHIDRNHLQKNRNGAVKSSKKDGVISDQEIPSHHSMASYNSKKSRSSYDRLQFPRHDLQMNNAILLGKGEFGEVAVTKASGIVEGETKTTVMVKALQSCNEDVHFEFKREMDMFNKLNHENVVKLLGICREVEPILVIFEYTDVGDLKQFLLATKKDTLRKGSKMSLSHEQMIHVCHQVALGMEHLSNHRFIHKDLAARNCLINSSFDIKITMQQLSSDIYKSDYVSYRNHLVPARWMAPEAFLEDEYSVKSDVWSFAVLVWEVLNCAKLPFADSSDETIINLLEQKLLKWDLPEGLTSGLFTLLMQCWSDSPKYRPTFAEIVIQMGDLSADVS